MEDWVYRALEKWPNVPALFGWLGLDRRGRWTIRGELISRPQIIDTINPNYAADEHGRWFFQNGPQRGYVTLESAPLVLHSDGCGRLLTHTGLAVDTAEAAWLDENGALWLRTAHGPAVLEGEDLYWLLEHLRGPQTPVDEDLLAETLALPSGSRTMLSLRLGATTLPLGRLDFDAAPKVLGFVREPQPRDAEAGAAG
ncbi:DUF2946 family protein [Sinimarinibacterium thermocellulolyticum]|uniref:DUF2946 family protein n=1 Tax=Sinimarinibacterium thermocellulolyticum TaxID=3170016 RepID=A0ABV2A969_9GAMM